jgi:molybdate transport system ATP-binding protein
MDIAPALERFPAQMSAGERQRVAIARALLIAPRLLLMDEPLASLDDARKQDILPYLERLHEEVDIPILYVSHAVDEVARLADHLVILDHGKVVADGALTDVLSRADLPVRLGEDTGAVVSADVVERDTQWHLLRAVFDGGELWLRDSGETIGQRIRVRILARDISLALSAHDDNSILNRLPARVLDIVPDRDDAMSLIRLSVGSSILIARLTRRSVENLRIGVGAAVCAQIKSVAIVR